MHRGFIYCSFLFFFVERAVEKSSGDINRVQEKTAVIGSHSESYHAVFRDEEDHSIIESRLKFTAQLLINVEKRRIMEER